MAQQLALPGAPEDRTIPTALHIEMQQSYLEYAMSVIVGRALPDVRDGLKPVHRRILYAMHELGLTPDRPFRKCARVVGDVLGKYHPHGDQSVYDALVRLVQDFSSRYPLLGGHGNFGSVDNDPPAAMRYTETRLSALGHGAVLGAIGEATVDFIGNFDNSQQEPTVLPAEFPLLLVNGCSGIAVGMATNIPPHNLGEIIDGLIALIDNPQLPDHELWTIIPGPDFPTGGEILGNEGICEAYRSGKGVIPLRAVVYLELASQQAKPGKSRKRRDALIVTELPFQVNKAALIERIADLVNNGKIEGIADLRDESDRSGMRIVIELKRDSDPEKVLEALYKQTPLQSNFGAIFLALVDRIPRQLSLRQALQEFLRFREATLSRQYRHELEQLEQRAHLVAGLLTALANLDGTIEILRQAPDGSTAKEQLAAHYGLTNTQADGILAMPLRRLTGLERHNLAQEATTLGEKIARFQKLLGDRRELLKALKKDLRQLRKQHADPRRTKILNAQPIPPQPEPVPLEPLVPRAPAIAEPVPPTPVQPVAAIATAPDPVPGETEPELTTAAPPVPVAIELAPEPLVSEPLSPARPISEKPVPEKLAPEPPVPIRQMNLLTVNPSAPQGVELEWMAGGRVRRVDRAADRWPGATELVLSRLEIMSDRDLLAIANDGRAYPLRVNALPPASSDQSPALAIAQVIPGLTAAEEVLCCLDSDHLPQGILLVSAQGRVKRLAIAELAKGSNRPQSLIKLPPDDRLLCAIPLQDETDLILGTSRGRMVRLALNAQGIPYQGRSTQGVAALRIGSQERLAIALPARSSDVLFLLTRRGYGKQMPLSALRVVSVGSMGDGGVRFQEATDELLGGVVSGGMLTVLTDRSQVLTATLDTLPLVGKEASVVPLWALADREVVTQFVLAPS